MLRLELLRLELLRQRQRRRLRHRISLFRLIAAALFAQSIFRSCGHRFGARKCDEQGTRAGSIDPHHMETAQARQLRAAASPRRGAFAADAALQLGQLLDDAAFLWGMAIFGKAKISPHPTTHGADNGAGDGRA